MLELIKQLALETLKVYAILIGIYFVLGLTLTRLNRFRPRIQERSCPPRNVKRDILQSMRSLLSISFFFAAGTVLHERGIGWNAPSWGVVNTAISLLASLIVFDACFYWGHRLIHTKPFFKRVHKWHHLSRTPTVWSNNSDSFLDNCVLQSYWILAHFILPVHPYVLLAHKIFDQVSGMIGHTGHEYTSGKTEVYPYPMIAVTFHDQHHFYFKYNFSTHFSIWDRLMGTMHPEYESRVKELVGGDKADVRPTVTEATTQR